MAKRAVFYIEYQNGRVNQIQFKTAQRARKAYELYSKEPEADARSWGWELLCDPPTLSQVLRSRKAGVDLTAS